MSEIVKVKKVFKGVRLRQMPARVVSHALPTISSPATAVSPQSPLPVVVEEWKRSPASDSEEMTIPAGVLEGEFQRGFDAGRISGAEQARKEIEERAAKDRQALGNLVANIGDQLGLLYERIEEEGFRLAIDIAERLAKREVTCDDEFVIRQIKEAIHRVAGVESIKVKVNPLDEVRVREYRGSILSSVESIRECVIEPDENIERGGCIIESASGNIDGRLATQLRQIESALFDEPVTGGRG